LAWPAALGGRALTALERVRRAQDVRRPSMRLPRNLKRYSLKVGGADSTRKRQALEEARRLGWLKKPVMDD
jgi:hypothetical protein